MRFINFIRIIFFKYFLPFYFFQDNNQATGANQSQSQSQGLFGGGNNTNKSTGLFGTGNTNNQGQTTASNMTFGQQNQQNQQQIDKK